MLRDLEPVQLDDCQVLVEAVVYTAQEGLRNLPFEARLHAHDTTEMLFEAARISPTSAAMFFSSFFAAVEIPGAASDCHFMCLINVTYTVSIF